MIDGQGSGSGMDRVCHRRMETILELRRAERKTTASEDKSTVGVDALASSDEEADCASEPSHQLSDADDVQQARAPSTLHLAFQRWMVEQGLMVREAHRGHEQRQHAFSGRRGTMDPESCTLEEQERPRLMPDGNDSSLQGLQ